MKNIVILVLAVAVITLSIFLVADDTAQAPTDSSSSSDTTSSLADAGDKLSFADQGLERLSTDIFDDKSVTFLDVSGNNLTGALPGEIRMMSNLVKLDASDNKLTGIPAEIGQLSKLRVADFSNNDISGLPNELGNLTNLETLDLRGNPNVSQLDLDGIKANIPNAQILTD